ncbi:metallophosphoesterase family protein [soil metagenome]
MLLPSLDRRRFLATFGAALAAGPILLGQDNAPKVDPKEPPPPTVDTGFRPDTLFLTWQQDPTTTMTISWVGPKGEAAVRYRNRGHGDWLYADAASIKPFPVIELPKTTPKYNHFYDPTQREIAPPPKGPWAPSGPVDHYVHRTELTELTPGTEYEFILNTHSPVFRFRTMPAKATQSFSFISGGDCATNAHAIANNKVAAAQDPMFVLIGGDLGYDNGTSGDTALTFIQNYSKTMIDSEGRFIPLVVAVGNHEVKGSFGKTLKEATFFAPLFDGFFKDHSYNTLDFGDYLSLVILDSGHCAPIKGEQTTWLNKTLADRAGRPHLIAVNHVPCYPSYRAPEGQKSVLGTGEDQRKHWVPLFEKHQVDVVLEHHDHTFKRTKPLKSGKVDEATGIVYLGDGSWGRLRVPNKPEKRSYLQEVSTNYHISLHRLEGEQRFHLALGETGKVLDIYRTAKKPRQQRVG